MTALTAEGIDRELAARTADIADLSTTLVKLDDHPGLEHVRRYQPTGTTAERWEAVAATIGRLWEDLASVTAALESATALRKRLPKPDDAERAELTRMLCAAEELVDGPNRMRAACAEVTVFLDAVDKINATVAKALIPWLRRLDTAGAAIPAEITDLLAVSATDPLSLTADDIGQRIACIAAGVDRQCAEHDEMTALQSNWPAAVAATGARLDDLRDAVRHAVQTCARAAHKVLAGPLPVPTDTEPDLRATLASLASMSPPDPAALRDLQRRIESAMEHVRRDEQLARGLLDRRTELKGRLRAYEAKAARLGLAEDAELLTSRGIAAGLLSRQPCDLRAVTQAVVDYQRLLAQKREGTQ